MGQSNWHGPLVCCHWTVDICEAVVQLAKLTLPGLIYQVMDVFLSSKSMSQAGEFS